MIAIPKHDLFPVDIDYAAEFGEYDRKWLTPFVGAARSRRVRPIEEWAEDEVTIPTGPFEGLKFRMDRQPVAIPLYKEFRNPHWQEYAITGSTQTGKSFLGFALPVCHTICEKREDAIISAPTDEILADKYIRDILPILKKSKYRDIIPSTGGGSRGGAPDRIDFENGTVLKFMSFQGGDKGKSSFTCPNIFFTEVDGAIALSTSQEANPLEQIKARARATEREKRFILYECTVSNKAGHIWQLTQVRGSAAQLMLKCPYCKTWTRPDREQFRGWEQAHNEIEAEELAAWHCVMCDHAWTEEDRKKANLHAKLMHRGQKIDKRGRVTGALPPTRLLGFRFSAVNNLFLPAKDIGVDCWTAEQDEDDLDGEKKLTQFVFALPYEPPGLDQVNIDRDVLEERTLKFAKGTPPRDTKWITIGFDVGKFDCWWVSIAWMLPSRVGLVMDYGRIRLRMEHNGKWGNADDFGFDTVFTNCVGEWKEKVSGGWIGAEGEVYDYDRLWIDARYQGEEPDVPVVYNTIKQWGDKRVMPIMGHATNSIYRTKYRAPRLGNKMIVSIGNGYHVAFVDEPAVMMMRAHINSDVWKTITQRRFTKQANEPGALMLYDSMNPREHAKYVAHIDSEYLKKHFEAGKGEVAEWIVKRQANHWLDATGYACAAGHHAGFRTGKAKKDKIKPTRRTGITGSGGRPFVASQR